MVFWVLSSIAILWHSGFVLKYLRAWRSLFAEKIPENVSTQNFYSILIAARNEERNIKRCIEDLLIQDFPDHRFEVIVIDDFSEDATVELVNSIRDKRLRLLQRTKADGFLPNKKGAISYGIQESKGNWILATDADCRRSTGWLKAVDRVISRYNPDMVVGPVVLEENSLFGKLQQLEFASVHGVSAAAIALKQPNTCHGSNIGYRKQRFFELNGFQGNEHFASGDDEFMMHKIHLNQPGSVRFVPLVEALVYTEPSQTLRGFYHQRKRWISKSRSYVMPGVTRELVFVYLYNLWLFCSIVLAVFGLISFLQPVLLLTIKLIMEYLFMKKVSTFFGISERIRLLPFIQIFHIVYIVVMGITAQFGGYTWKGRKLK
jgi:cellulose synthase/poly-beta-1,6-N-acetylglucosamine synthase-like glycosyltransferase